MLREETDGPGEAAGGGVAAGEQDIDELVADGDGIAHLGHERVDEHVAFFAFFFAGFGGGGCLFESQGIGDDVVDEVVDEFAGFAEAEAVDEPVEVAEAATHSEVMLPFVKGVGESHADLAALVLEAVG